MRKLTIVGMVALLSAWTGWADAARNAAARAELIKGVESIDAPGGALPGPFVCLSDDAFNVIAARNYDGTIHPVTVGAFYGEGRVVALGHPAFLSNKATMGETAQYLRNATTWLRQGKAGKVAVIKNEGVLANLKSCGVEAEKVESVDQALTYPVMVLMSSEVASSEFAKVHDYVRKGGGLLSEALTWGWAYFAERSTGLITPSLYYDAEKLFAPFGFVAGDSGVNRSGGKGFETAVPFPVGTTFPEALKALRDGVTEKNASVRAQVTKTLVQAAYACPPSAEKVFGELSVLGNEPQAQKRPSPEQPLKAADALSRVGMVLRQNAWQQDPVKLWPADPAAAVYPGRAKAGAKVVDNEKIPVDLSVPRWRSTGLFADAGAPITVKLAPGAEKLGLKLRVGTTGDDNTTCDEWKRAPLVTVTMPLDKPEMTFSTPFGGLLYVVVPDGKKGTADVTISGAVRAAHFVLGRDTNADWKRILAEGAAPQAEIEGKRYVITLFADRAKECDDPEWIAKFWDRVVEVDTEMTGLAGLRNYKERICADVQLRSGWLHDGYPMMYHSLAKNREDIITRSLIEKSGCWGVQHELGHNFQNHYWTFDGTAEVTVNLFTLYSSEKAAGLTDLELFEGVTGKAACKRRAVRWVEDGKKFDDWKNDYFLALDTFVRIRRVFGWQPFLTMFREYRDPVVGKLPANNQEKMDQWATRLSRILNRNFADYFTAWSWPLSESAVAECAKYPEFSEEESAVLYEFLSGVPDDSIVDIKITPAEGAIANVGGWTSFVFSYEPEARSRALSNELRVKGTYTLHFEITDETAGKKYAFAYPIRDMNKDAWPVFRVATIPYGLTPKADHAYTLKMIVKEGDRVRFEGVSAKGAFVSTDNGFLSDGPIDFEPTVKIRKDSPLKGKSILFVGDSITEAICEVYNPHTRYTAGWPGRIGWANGMRWINVGISGATVSNNWGPYNTTRQQLNWHKDMPFDILITHGGINDAMGKCPAGTMTPGKPEDYNPSAEDFKTFAGSLEYFFWQAKNEHPTAKIGFIINFKVMKSNWSDWAKMPEYLPLMKAICKKWGIPYLNLWENESVTEQLKPETRTALGDYLHPNTLGYDILYPYIEQFVEAVYTGAAKPGEEFVPKAVYYKSENPNLCAIGPDDVNVAAGKLSLNGGNWNTGMTDGKIDGYIRCGSTTTFEQIEKSTCYQEIDLAGLYTIDKIRVFPFVGNGVGYWAAYATDDATKPLNEWTLLYHKTDQKASTADGYAVAFKPVDAQFVRVYGVHEIGQGDPLFIEAEVYGKLSPRNQIPTVNPVVPTNLVDVASGKRETRPSTVWCADPGQQQVSRGLEGDDYIEIDLGDVCEIEYLQAKGPWNILGYWEAYASLDATKPIGEWTKLGGKYAVFPEERNGQLYTIAFVPVKARYVRVYAMRSWGRDDFFIDHPKVFGKVLKGEVAPAPEHALAKNPTYQHDADWHWFACTNAGCTARVNAARHTWDLGKVSKLSEGGRPAEITKTCRVCRAERVFPGVDSMGVNLALGRPAKFSGGSPAEWMTDGSRAYVSGWRGVIGNAQPLDKIDDDAACYFEIDLGAQYDLSSVNFVDDLSNAKRMFAIFVSPDETAPITNWTRAAVLNGVNPAQFEGRTIRFAKPVTGRYVRIYSLVNNLAIAEFSAYGQLSAQPAPVSAHTFSTNRVFNADQHWFACTDKGCTFTRLHENHRFRGMELKSLPTATKDGEKFRDCDVCAFREITPLPSNPTLGEIVSLGKPARIGTGKSVPRVTDGKFNDGEWTTKDGRAQMTVDDADKCYFEIDLEKVVPVTAVTYMAFENSVKWAVYGTDDAAKPIAQWRKLAEKTDTTKFPFEGWTLFCDGTPVRYVRVYGLEYNDQNGIMAREITVYGRQE